MEQLSHLISLSVGTSGADDHAETFDGVTNFGKMLAANHGYVNISSQLVGVEEVEEEDLETENVGCTREHLHHDEQTLVKFYTVLSEHGVSEVVIREIVNDLQNAGILFRERDGSDS